MPARLRPLEPADLPRVVDLSLRAWEPVFTSLRTVLGEEVFLRLYPDWRSDQERAVTATCTLGVVAGALRVASAGQQRRSAPASRRSSAPAS